MQIEDLVLLKPVGKGAFGEVFLTTKRGTQQQFATKKVQKSVVLQEKVKKYFNNEIFILRNVNHPNIIKLHEIKQTLNNFYLVFDLCNGGNLTNYLEKYMKNFGKPFTQEIVQHIMKQVVSGIQYLHNKKILHRDLKLDNILLNFDNAEDNEKFNLLKSKVKIIDFGFARYLENDVLAQSILGSPLNMAPQILMKMRRLDNNQTFGYDQKADIWSIGTICYELLVGSHPFESSNYEELTSKIQKGNYKIPNNLQLSIEAVSFLNAMLQYDPKKRLDINDLAKHKFLTVNTNEFTLIDLTKDDLMLNTKKINNISSLMINHEIPDYTGPKTEIKNQPDDVVGKMIQGNKIDDFPTEESSKNEKIFKEKNKKEKDLKDLLHDSFEKMNKYFNYIEPMLIPVNPNIDPKVVQLDI
jgi:serine/threonine protein kinase